MAIKCNFDTRALNAYFDALVKELASQINIQLGHLGQECVKRIREKEGTIGWNDHTHNLRSSIGAEVLINGKRKMQTVFEQVLNGKEGVIMGQRYIDQLAKQYTETYALVVVAGMEYASYVEDMQDKDVLASTRLWAEQQVEKRIQDAIKGTMARLNKIKI